MKSERTTSRHEAQHVSRQHGKKRHVSKNTLTRARLCSGGMSIAIKRKLKRGEAQAERLKQQREAEKQRERSMQKGRGFFGRIKSAITQAFQRKGTR